MNQCRDLERYLRRQLDDAQEVTFEQHLAHCAACQADKIFWEDFDGDYADWSQSKTQPGPTDQNVMRFRARMERGQRPLWSRPVVWIATMGVAATIALAWFSIALQSDAPNVNPSVPLARQLDAKSDSLLPRFLESTDDQTKIITLDQDKLGLDTNTRIAVLESSRTTKRLRLERGTAAFDVAPRAGGVRFEVLVARHVVKVVGTRFAVSIDAANGFAVSVAEGVVKVTDEHSSDYRVESGSGIEITKDKAPVSAPLEANDTTHINTLLGLGPAVEEDAHGTPDSTGLPKQKQTAPSAPKLESLATYREMVLVGNLEPARRGLRSYTRVNSTDEKGWMLLADCERKLENWTGSVRSYKKVIKQGNARTAAKARYLAAEILGRRLNKHKEATVLYEEYLRSGEGSNSLRAAAKVSLGRSLIALGQKQKAKKILEEVVDSQKESFVAKNARNLLDTLEE